MSGRCADCGHGTEWDDALGSAICTSCGTLADPTQNVLASHLDSSVDNHGSNEFYNWTGGNPTLRSIRNKNGWALSGQGKEVRDRQNSFAMHTFIKTLCMRLSNPGAAHRSQMIFDQAMARGEYRWGRKAKLTAGASVAVALRESHKSDSLRDIAILLDDSHISLSRAFISVINLLQLDLTSSDPSVHLAALQTHLVHLLRSSDITLPKSLITLIKPLEPRFTYVMKTCHSLASLITQLGSLSHLPTQSTACAILVLALEGEHRSTLPNCGVLAQALGTRFGVGKGVVMQRYKIIHDAVQEWIEEVPWLDAPKDGQYKAGKRNIVARGLKDVIQFRDEIWRKKIHDMEKVVVHLELDGEKENLSDDDTPDEVPRKRKDVQDSFRRPYKKRKTEHSRVVESASQFLLNQDGSSDTGFLAHLLSSDIYTLSYSFLCPPTRLQMLVVSRVGGEPCITDDELFEEGELDGFLRDDKERDQYAHTVDWDEIEEERAYRRVERAQQKARGNRKREVVAMGKPEGTKRIDMEALKRFMDPGSCLDTLDEDEDGKEDAFYYFQADDKDEENDEGPVYLVSTTGSSTEEVEEDWRPLSPSGGFAGNLEQYDF